ncbi:MAG: BON domain-containing protein [Verrucomicrobiota bacterium]
MKRWIWAGFAIVVTLALVATAFILPAMQRELNNSVRQKLAVAGPDFDDVTVTFSGQEATLTGSVATVDQKYRAGGLVGEQIRGDGAIAAHLNPVTAVINFLVVDPDRDADETFHR